VWAKGSVAESSVRQYTAMDNNLYTVLCSKSLSCSPHTYIRSTLNTDLDMSLAPVYKVPARVGVLVRPRSEKQRLSAGVRPSTPVIFPFERNSQSKLSTCNSIGNSFKFGSSLFSGRCRVLWCVCVYKNLIKYIELGERHWSSGATAAMGMATAAPTSVPRSNLRRRASAR
jgi:hypothetical protein